MLSHTLSLSSCWTQMMWKYHQALISQVSLGKAFSTLLNCWQSSALMLEKLRSHFPCKNLKEPQHSFIHDSLIFMLSSVIVVPLRLLWLPDAQGSLLLPLLSACRNYYKKTPGPLRNNQHNLLIYKFNLIWNLVGLYKITYYESGTSMWTLMGRHYSHCYKKMIN